MAWQKVTIGRNFDAQQTLSAAAPTGDAAPSDLSSLMDDGIVTVDELRASKGLAPLAQDGD